MCKSIILVMSYAEFLKFDFIGLDLFIPLMHILLLKQILLHFLLFCILKSAIYAYPSTNYVYYPVILGCTIFIRHKLELL